MKIINEINEIFINGDNIGRRRVMVVGLLVIFVNDVIIKEDSRIISYSGNDFRGDNLFFIYLDSFDI